MNVNMKTAGHSIRCNMAVRRYLIFQAVLCSCLAALVVGELKDEYDHAAFLDSDEMFKLYWSVKDVDKSVDFAAEVNTTGWIGFGISAGLSGSMKSADIVVGWVDAKGGHLKDYHGQESGNGWPIEDKEQNYELVGSSETNGVTVLKFKRKINTCDKEDREIPVGTSKVIYAYGSDDTLKYHDVGKRGARSINLLSYVKNAPPPKNAKYFDVISHNVSVPGRKTTYWCQAMKLSDVVQLSKKQHIVEIEPVIEKKDRGVVHHMVIYVCKDSFNETHLNVTGACYDFRNMPPSIKECVGASPMFAWAVGGVNFKYPSHVGWPIGSNDSMKYIVIETHFDNPSLRSDLVVTSGLRFYYDNPRKYDAATLTTGLDAGPGLVIPPMQEKWISHGTCTKACSEKINEPRALQGGTIKFFASFPHSHVVGTGIWTNVVRNGKEIKELIRDENYDFDYQQTHLLREEVEFKAGDELYTYCRYNTMKRKDATSGGLSTRDEMCLNFILYYPKIDLSQCSTLNLKVRETFATKYGNTGKYNNHTYFKDWDNVKWNKTMIDELKALYRDQDKHTVYQVCIGDAGKTHNVGLCPAPLVKEFLPAKKDICTAGIAAAPRKSVNIWLSSFMIIPTLYHMCF